MATVKRITRRVNVFINGEQVGNTLKDLRGATRRLSNELATLEPGTAKFVKKSAELQKVKSRMAAVKNEINGTAGTLSKIQKQLGPLGSALVATFSITALLSLGKELFNLSISLDEIARKAKIVFGQSLPLLTEAAEENAQQMGQTTNEYIKSATAIADLLKPIGFTTAQSAELSSELVNLSGALSEWTGGSVTATEVTDILAKAVLGENEQLKTLGIAIRKDTDEFRDLVKQKIEDEGATKLQAEALAEFDLIMRKTTDAQNAFNDGAQTMLRRRKDFTTFWREMKENAADFLGDFLTRVSALPEQFELAINGIKNLSNEVFGTTFDVKPVEEFTNAILSADPILLKMAETAELYGLNTEEGQKATEKLGVALERALGKETGAKVFGEFVEQQQKAAETQLLQEKAQLDFSQQLRDEASAKRGEKEAENFLKIQEKIDQLAQEVELKKLAADERELEQIRIKFQKQLEQENINQAQKDELEAIRDEELALKREEQEAKEIEKITAFEEAKIAALADTDEKQFLQIETKFQKLIAQAEAFNQDTSDLERARNDEVLALTDELNKKQLEKIKKADEELLAQREATTAAQIGLGEDLSESFFSLVSVFADSEGDLAEINRIATLFQLGLDTASAISSVVASAAATSITPIDLAAKILAGIATITTNIATAKRLIKPVPKLFEGGPTGTGFGSPDESGARVAGVVHANEWVGPEWMTTSPRYARTFEALEHARRGKIGYQEGGPVVEEPAAAAADLPGDVNGELLGAVRRLTNRLDNPIPSRAIFTPREVDDINEFDAQVADIQEQATLIPAT